MPTPDEKPPGRFARVLSVVRWLAVALILVVLAVRYLGPDLAPEAEQIEIKSEASGGIDDLVEKLTPPTQTFTNPTSQLLVALGNDLVSRPRDRQEAARQLLALTENPESLGDDITAYLAVRSAYWQLRRDPEVRGSLEAALMLWDTAERLEGDGSISTATTDDETPPIK